MLEWLIIGGGVHGTHLSLHLTRARGVPHDRIRVLDPHPEPLARWEACSRNCGMGFLRSPVVHHIDLIPLSLITFADSRENQWMRRFIEPFQRPSTRLFGAHSRHVVRKHRLDELRIQGRAVGLSAVPGGFRVETEAGALESRKVLLALSAGDMPAWPAWGRAMKEAGAPIDHVFDAGFDREAVPPFERAVVIGGGITGAQVALALAAKAPGAVTLVTAHTPRVRRFDSNPGWMGPLNIDGFRREPDMAKRRAIIRAARHRGTMPAEVRGQLRRAAELGKITVRLTTVTGGAFAEGAVSLECGDGMDLRADRVVLATGFETRRPGGAWLDRAIEEMGLPVSPCGYPVVDAKLAWQPGLHVTGPLAELEIGPAARNIIGARLSAERFTERYTG